MKRFCTNVHRVADLKPDGSNHWLACFNETNPDYAKAVARRIKINVPPGDRPKPKPLTDAEKSIDLADIPEDEVKWFGLGDLVAAGIKSVGLDKLAEKYTKITGKPCGCGSRQQILNKVKLWKQKPDESVTVEQK